MIKTLSFFGTVGLSVFVSLTNLVVAQDWNVCDHVAFDKIMVQSHRGAGALSPENSVEALELAWQWGTIPELDLRTTKDGVIVAFHDNNFKRILPNASAETQKKGIADLTLAEVKRLDIGVWKGKKFEGQRVPTIAELCELLKNDPKRMAYIDIKNVDFEQLARETESYHPRLVLASTKYDEIRRWKKLAPKSLTLHWMGGTQEELTKRLDLLQQEKFADIDQLQIHVKFDKDGKFLLPDDFLRETGNLLRKYGVLYQTLPWDCKDGQVYKRLLDLGCASFATDYPDVTMTAIKEYYAEKKTK